jgi:NHLM bacteriocin system ABC transporter ATP-binding protein
MTVTQDLSPASTSGYLADTATANRTALGDSLAALHLGTGTAAPGADDDRTLAVLRAVAPALGKYAPTELPPAVRSARDPLTAGLRQLGVRWRQITLPDDGTGHGHTAGTSGPMVGFAAADGRPVALLPTGRRAAHRAGGSVPLTRRAYLLYRPLPSGVPTPAGLLRFALAAPGARRDLLVLGAAGLASAVLGLAVPLSTGLLMPQLVAAGHHPLRWLAVLLAAVSVSAGLLLLVRNVAAVRLTGRVQAALEPAVWDRLLSHDARFFRDFSTGDLVHRANAIAEARQALSEVLVGAVLGAFFSLSGLLVLLAVDLRLGGLLLAAALVATALLALLGRRRQRYESQVYALHGRLHGTLYGLMLGIDKIQTAGREIQAFARWAVPFAAQKRADTAAMRADAASAALTTALQPVLLALLLAGVTLEGSGGTDMGHLMAAGIAAGQVALALGQVTHAAATAYGIAPVLDRLRPILAEPAKAADTTAGRGLLDPGTLRGAVALDAVSFRYPGAAAPALDAVSLHAEPGELVAVVGPSGAGKSTLVRVLLGFEHPDRGSVRYDGQDLAGLDVRMVRRQLGTVLQNGRLLRGSLLENLAGTDPEVTAQDVWDAAELAGIADELRALPLGLGTRVGEDAQGFSGGQVQRMLLARALVRRPAVLLLDEATSALDNATQRRVADGIAALATTRLVVAHRLSTIRRADRIYVLDGGRVAAEGTYEGLLDTDPLFTRLVRPQEL